MGASPLKISHYASRHTSKLIIPPALHTPTSSRILIIHPSPHNRDPNLQRIPKQIPDNNRPPQEVMQPNQRLRVIDMRIRPFWHLLAQELAQRLPSILGPELQEIIFGNHGSHVRVVVDV